MSVEIRKLANGLTIACENMPHLRTVAINVMVNVGSRDESENESGISHLIEHMAFKGTATRNARMIAEEFDNIGGYNNAYTSRECTSFHCKVMASEWKRGLEILADITLNSTFPEDELEKEKEVVLQEIMENDDNPDDVVGDIFQLSAYPDQAIGGSILGTAESVMATTREQLLTYIDKHYQPSNMVVALAGAINIDEVVAEAEKIFNFQNHKPAPALIPAVYKGGISIRKNTFEQVHVIIGFEGLSSKDDHYYTQHVLSTLLGGSMSSRLFQEIREKRGLTYSIGSHITSYDDTGTFTISAGTSEDKFKEVIEVCFNELLKVMEHVGEEEVERSKKQLIAGMVMSGEGSNHSADELAKCILTHGRFISNEEVFEKINRVTTGDVLYLANKLFNSRMTFAATGKIENSAEIRLGENTLM